jgi:cytosine deaminase
MLDVAHMALHVGQLTSREAMRFCFDAITVNPARIMGLEHYGLDVGCHADLVVLQAKDPIEAIRLRATRLFVVRRGEVIAETPERVAALSIEGRPPKWSGSLRAARSESEWTTRPRRSCPTLELTQAVG